MSELESEREWLTRLLWLVQQQQRDTAPRGTGRTITVSIDVFARPEDVRR